MFVWSARGAGRIKSGPNYFVTEKGQTIFDVIIRKIRLIRIDFLIFFLMRLRVGSNDIRIE